MIQSWDDQRDQYSRFSSVRILYYFLTIANHLPSILKLPAWELSSLLSDRLNENYVYRSKTKTTTR